MENSSRRTRVWKRARIGVGITVWASKIYMGIGATRRGRSGLVRRGRSRHEAFGQLAVVLVALVEEATAEGDLLAM